jgi:DNA-binding NarL/FixJ family response regulator
MRQPVSEEIRIVIAEDHPFFRDGLRRALENSRSFDVVGEAADGLTALDQVRSLRPDVAILDIRLPKLNGVALVRNIRQEQIPVEIVFLTICDDEEMFEEAIALGVKGYLLKDCTESEVLRCLDAVSSGQHYTTPAMTTYLVNKTRRVAQFTEKIAGLRLLTPQERAILKEIAHEKTSKEIAQAMGITQKTVDTHRSNICRKLEIHGQHVLSRFAARHRTEI